MEFFENLKFEDVRAWLELVYFASGIGVLIFAGFGMYQLKLAKEQIESSKEIFRKQSMRSSFEAAVNECNRFSEKYFPLIYEFDCFVESKNITFFEKSKIERKDKGFGFNFDEIDREDLKTLNEKADLAGKIMNGLEGFALYVISGVADEDIAFHTLGKVFVEETEKMSKLLPFTDTEQDDSKGVWALYFRWQRRLEHQKLITEKQEIEKRLKKAKVQKFTALGTEI
ncbi:TPA: hypothetical protein I7724_22130 [Vibrio vulnificus]|nr:hypothetical protein [Vibrio vulnificus]